MDLLLVRHSSTECYRPVTHWPVRAGGAHRTPPAAPAQSIVTSPTGRTRTSRGSPGFPVIHTGR